MESGYYETIVRVKESAVPIDNVTKFAYYDDDYETVEVWYEYTEEELKQIEESEKLQQQQEKDREFLDTAPNIQADQDRAICELYELIVGGEA